MAVVVLALVLVPELAVVPGREWAQGQAMALGREPVMVLRQLARMNRRLRRTRSQQPMTQLQQWRSAGKRAV